MDNNIKARPLFRSTRSPNQGTYIVQRGDSMYTIAQKNGITLDALITANLQIEDITRIYPGQTINMPGQINGEQNGQEQEIPQSRETLRVSAAASLQDAMEELRRIYLERYPNTSILYRFAASGTLSREIEEERPTDIFISAAEAQMNDLSRRGLIVESSRKDLLGNELVLIAPQNTKLRNFNGLTSPSIAKIAIGRPQTVPAGMYAKEALTSLQLWDKVSSKLVYLSNVRRVLESVETGEADAGLVYRSDALSGTNIKTVATAPASSHSPIIYPMAIINSSTNKDTAANFTEFLSGDEAAQVFSSYGFTVLR